MLWFVYFDVLFLFFALLNPHHYLGNLLEVDTVVRVPITGTMDTKKLECSMALITVRNYLDTEPLFEIFLYYLLHHFHVVTLITEQPSLPKGEGFETRSLFISIFSNFSLPCPLQTQHQKEAGEHGGALQAWEVADGRGRRKVRTVPVPYHTIPVPYRTGSYRTVCTVFRIRDSLRRIRILGSVNKITDPDPALFVTGLHLQDSNKTIIFFLSFFYFNLL